jgi:hypothetical protein
MSVRAKEFVRSSLPTYARRYLQKYLNDVEIDAHFTYDASYGRIVLLDTLPEFYWGRIPEAVPGRPKVFTDGEVPFEVFTCDLQMSDDLVIVEDPVSAIKVSHRTKMDALPLFGSTFSRDWIHMVSVTHYKNLYVWLDNDKAKEGLKLCLSLRNLFKTHWIVSKEDPKYYSSEAIDGFLQMEVA